MVIRISAALFCGILLNVLQTAVTAQDRELPLLPKGMLLETPVVQHTTKLREISAVLVFEETFESGAPGTTQTGSWAIGAPASGPGSGYNSARCAGTNLAGNYPDNADDWLISPAITLPATNVVSPLTLYFMEWFEFESGYDYGFVKISTDGGATWNSLSVRDGSSAWRLGQIDLTHYAGLSIKLAFHLTSDGSRTFSGWYLDGIQIVHDIAAPLEAALTSLNSQNFPFIFMNVAVSADGQGLPNLEQSNFTAFENGVLQSDYFNVIPPQAGGGVRLADIVFVMDNSGSMGNEINAVSSNVFNFVNALSSSGIDFALGLCRFGSLTNSGNPIIEDNGNLTTDVDYFKNIVWHRNDTTGFSEPGYHALTQSAISFSFRPGAQKIFIIITDETPNQGETTQAQALTLLEENAITLFALTAPVLFGHFDPLTAATNGRYFDIFSPFDEILRHITAQISNSYVVSYRSSNPALDGTLRTVEVRITHRDDDVTVTGSYIPGAAPTIRRTAATLALHDQAWAQGAGFMIEAEIVDNAAPLVQEARVYYKRTGEAAYSSAVMAWHTGNVYRGNIPGSAAAAPGMDYYLTASDGVSTSSDPRTNPASSPHQIAILPNIAPAITHTPVMHLIVGTPIAVTASIVDHTNFLSSAKLLYRKTGQLLYQQQKMLFNSGNQYTAAIPADYATIAGVEYYLAAEDDFGVSSSHGSADQPHQITPGNDAEYRPNSGIYFYPNPFNPQAGLGTFRYSLSHAVKVTIKIYDAANVWIRTVIAGVERQGNVELAEIWDGSTSRGELVANGIYFYVMEFSSGEKAMGKIAVLR